MTWNRKHLLDIQSLSPDEIVTVLDTATQFKAVGERAIKKVPALRGKTVINLFIEPSTRTRISFELAALRLTADVINFTAEASSLKKGETLKDTARNLEALNADIIIIRHSATGAPHFLSRFLRGSVINAVAKQLPELIGGSADLNPSTDTALKNSGDFESPQNLASDRQGAVGEEWGYAGRNIYYGIREHAMGAVTNGLVYHGGLRAFSATFLVFSDYMRPPLRLA